MVFPQEIAEAAKRAATQAGFDLAGIAPVRKEDMPELGAFIEWVDAPQPTEEPAVEETGKKRKPAKEAAATDEAKPSKKTAKPQSSKKDTDE